MSKVLFTLTYRGFEMKVYEVDGYKVVEVESQLKYAPVIYDNGVDKIKLVASVEHYDNLSELELKEYVETLDKAYKAIEYFHKHLFLKNIN